MTRGLQRELALIAEILETTENSQTEQFHSAQRDVFSEDTIADLGTSFTLSRDQQQSVSQKISLQPEDTDRNVPAQLPTPGLTPPPPPAMSTPEPEIYTPEAGSDGAASEKVHYDREESNREEVNRDSSPSAGLPGAPGKTIPKPRRTRNDGISAENLISGTRSRKHTVKDEDYAETQKAKYRHEVSQNSSNFANLVAFHTSLKHRLYRKNVPPEPKSWKDLQTHPYHSQFTQAAQAEMDQHWARGTLKKIPLVQAKQHPTLLKWVFKYKLDKRGYIKRFKVRLVFRGDLQAPLATDTYAATLAAKSFRMMIVIATKWDLTVWQLDAVSTFTNNILEDTHLRFLPGQVQGVWVLFTIDQGTLRFMTGPKTLVWEP